MGPRLLHYRAWQGDFRASAWSPWPIARVALEMMFRRKLFWALYAFALLTFLMFFFGQYLLAWAEAQSGEQSVRVLGIRQSPGALIEQLRVKLHMDGSAANYRAYFSYQAVSVMVALALAGSLVVGNDFQFGSLAFYLSKPLAPLHYVIGKCLAIAVFVNLMTTLPALVLFVQYRSLYDWGDFVQEMGLVGGIVAYGQVLAVFLSLMLVATASWLRRTVPLVMAWTTLFYFLRQLGFALVDGLNYDPRWRLLDLWNDTTLVGNVFLGLEPVGRQPEWYEAALVLGVLCLLCLSYLNRRIRAVEIVR
jgi:hypothetical protein